MAPNPLRPFARLVLIFALALGACHDPSRRPTCPAGKVCIEYGNDIEPATLDPSMAQLVAESLVIGDLMMGLTTEAADGSVIPGMAARWETSPDGLTWTFHLRPTQWSDGAPVTADDFVFAYRRILDPKTGSPYAYMVELLKNGAAVTAGKAAPETIGARALGPRTLELRLEHPAPYLPQILTHNSFYPVPEHVVRRYGDAWVQPGRYVSNGAYRLVGWRLGDKMTVEKNPRFFDAAHVCVDRINYYPTSDYVAAERRIGRGELDLITQFQSNRLQHIREVLPGYARTHLWMLTAYITFNNHDPGPLRDLRVRRALSESIDRQFITEKLLRAGQAPAYSFVPPGTANAEPGAATVWAKRSFAERQAEARRLLAQAGYGPGHPLKLEMKTATVTDSLLLVQAVQADWRDVGVDVRIAQTEGQILFADLNARNFQAGFVSWIADYNDPLTFLSLFQSNTGAQNYGDYANPAYDAELAAADQEPDARRRAALLARAEQIMLADEAVAPVYFGVSRSLVNPKVTGWVDNLQNRHRARWLCVKPGAAP